MKKKIIIASLLALISAPVFSQTASSATYRLGADTVSFQPSKQLTKTADYTVTTSDMGAVITVTASSANITLTLPSLADLRAAGVNGSVKIVKADSTTYDVIASPATGNTIGGESARYLNSQNAYMVLRMGANSNWEIDYESPYVVEDHEAGTVVFDGLNTFTSDVTLTGTTPQLTIGDTGDEDTYLVFDGQATDDFYIAFDTADDDLNIGYGGATEAAAGTQTAIEITDSATPTVTIPYALTSSTNTVLGDAATDGVTIAGAILGGSPFILDGTTDDTNELTVTLGADPAGDLTLTVPAMVSEAMMISSLTTNNVNVANSVWGVSNGLAFGGATGADGFEVTLSPSADPGADVAIGLPATAGTLKNTTGGGSNTTVEAGAAGATNTLDVTDCGKTFTAAADADAVFVLPAASATTKGCEYTFINIGADTNNLLTIDPNAADQIWGISLSNAAAAVDLEGAAGDAVSNTKATSERGDNVTLQCDGVDGWHAKGFFAGIWADIN